MTPTGTLDNGDLVLVRTFAAPIGDVWASITESDRLARWYGTWTGDPATGSVLVTMTAEDRSHPPVRHEIEACEPPRLASVSSVDDYGGWHLTARLSEADGVTTLELRQRDLDPGLIDEVGPGWDWYLDRLVAAVAGHEPPDLEAFETRYLPAGDAYRRLTS